MRGVNQMEPIYKRVLLKLSGEVLAGEKGVGIDFDNEMFFVFYNIFLYNIF